MPDSNDMIPNHPADLVLPAVPEHWDVADWDYAFSGCASTPEWVAASPPPKDTVAPLQPEDVAEVTHIWAISGLEYADQDMQALMRLKDGRWACVETWSDSSGYGCRDGTEWHVGTLVDVIRYGLSEVARSHFSIPGEVSEMEGWAARIDGGESG